VRLLLAVLILACATGAAAAQKAKARNALYGAIAYHQASGAVGWASDRHSSREARVEALKQCGRDDCVIVATVSRDCVALAANARKFSAQKGATQQEAETKALAHCGADCRIAAWVCTR
jgi:opacity protein-like surface antigen